MNIRSLPLLGAFIVLMLSTSGCTNFLGVIPKGQKIPKTLEDYNAFIRNNFSYHYYDSDQLYILMGDVFQTPTAVSSPSLTRTHYLADESVKRVDVMGGVDKQPYFGGYEGIFAWNLIIEEGSIVTDGTVEERNRLIAQARVLRAMHYFYLTNYYADQYSQSTRENLSVPLVTSPTVDAPSPQVTLEEMYGFLIEDLQQALREGLPTRSESILHPNLATGYGMLARVYLSMGNYEQALHYSSLALEQNDRLYDWIGYYMNDRARFDDPKNYVSRVNGNPETDNVENYIYGYGSTRGWMGLRSLSYAISTDRAALFEPGDTRLLTHWKFRTSAKGYSCYVGIYSVEMNRGGVRAPEMYYIKAECLARKGDAANISEAMDLVNAVRKTRILPEYYKPWSANSTEEAVKLIIRDKANEYIQNQVIYCDYRRLNKDPKYARNFTREVDGNTYTLQPDSHLWIMPFHPDVMSNPGNNPIRQNVDK